MPEVMQPRQRETSRFLASTVMIVASWQLRRTWFLLLFITFGMIAAVVIACAIPLLSDVMMTAGLRSTLRATPDSAEITLNTGTEGISTPIVESVHTTFDDLFHHSLGKSILPEQFSIISEDFSLFPSHKNTLLTVYGTSLQQAAAHLEPIQGRLAGMTSNPVSEIEVMMTPDTAQRLGVHVGSSFKLSLNYFLSENYLGDPSLTPNSSTITAHLVGLFNVTTAKAAYWHGEDFKTLSFAGEGTSTLYHYTLLVSDNALLALFDSLRSTYSADAVYSTAPDRYTLLWHYRLDSSHLTISTLDSLINQMAGIQSTTDSMYGDLENGGSSDAIPVYPYLFRVGLTSPALSPNPTILEQFRDRVAVARIPAGVFTLLILTLILFFVSLMTMFLVDWQADTIAVLRSRGGSPGQIFGALLLQGVGLGIIALGIGLPVAGWSVLLLAQRMLPASELDALNIITSNPLQAVWGTIWYALAVVLAALFTMSLSFFFAARMNVLSLRREASRSNKRPLWQRFNLDVIAGAIALFGYGISLYITSIGTVLQGDAKVLLATPLSIITPFFLIVGCLLLFLRIFPWLLHLGARFAARGRGAVSLLALAQIARSPRQSIRMTLLLALATAFALFTLVYTATQSEHLQEIVTYQTGADFSAELYSVGVAPSHLMNQYKSIPGVLSASVGFDDRGYGGTAHLPMEIQAVDAASFGRTVIWPSDEAYRSARPLLQQLIFLRQQAIPNDIVPTIVDTVTIHKLQLPVGSFFTVTLNNVSPQYMQCFIVGVVDSIPTINDHFAQSPSVAGGVLVDYQAYTNAYARDVKKIKNPSGLLQPPAINSVWLHTKDDPVSLASVRTALKKSDFRFSHLIDRRLLLTTLQADPLYLVLEGVLIIGTVTALLLALIGDLLASWLSARTRMISFVTLRALGTTPRQVMSMLTWEQAVVYITGFLLGGAFGTLLATSVIPELTFTDLNSNLSNDQFFALQSALSTQLVVPPSLPLMLLVLAGIYTIALTMMVRVVSRPAPGQTLRLNQD